MEYKKDEGSETLVSGSFKIRKGISDIQKDEMLLELQKHFGVSIRYNKVFNTYHFSGVCYIPDIYKEMRDFVSKYQFLFKKLKFEIRRAFESDVELVA